MDKRDAHSNYPQTVSVNDGKILLFDEVTFFDFDRCSKINSDIGRVSVNLKEKLPKTQGM